MKFTKQDLWTFLIGLGASVVIVVATSLLSSAALFDGNGREWLIGLLTGSLTSTGRYLLTYLAQKGFTPQPPGH